MNQYATDPERYILISDVADGLIQFELGKNTEEISASTFPDYVLKAVH